MAREPHRNSEILDAVALLVVDMQESFLKAIDGAPAIVERCAFAIEAARTFGIRVIFTEQVPEKLGPTDSRLIALAGGNARVFAKSAFSALQANGLQDQLRRLGVYHLLLVGIETPVCIYQTALHASDSDFDVTVLSDCVSARRPEDSRVVLNALAQANCHILPSETVFYSMLGHAAHPRFGNYTKLVKRYNAPDPLNQPREEEPETAPSGQAPQPADARPAQGAHASHHEGEQAQGEHREERRGRRRRGRGRGRGRDRDRDNGAPGSAPATSEGEPFDSGDETDDSSPEPVAESVEASDAFAAEPTETHDTQPADATPDTAGADEGGEPAAEESAPKKRPRRRRGGSRRRRGAEGESAEAASAGGAADSGEAATEAPPPPSPSDASEAPAS